MSCVWGSTGDEHFAQSRSEIGCARAPVAQGCFFLVGPWRRPLAPRPPNSRQQTLDPQTLDSQSVRFQIRHRLRSGEAEVDGTGDRKTVRCPSIGSCMILMQTRSSGGPLSMVSIPELDLHFLYARVNQRQTGQVTVKRSYVPEVVLA